MCSFARRGYSYMLTGLLLAGALQAAQSTDGGLNQANKKEIGKETTKYIKEELKESYLQFLSTSDLSTWPELKERFDNVKQACEKFEQKYKNELGAQTTPSITPALSTPVAAAPVAPAPQVPAISAPASVPDAPIMNVPAAPVVPAPAPVVIAPVQAPIPAQPANAPAPIAIAPFQDQGIPVPGVPAPAAPAMDMTIPVPPVVPAMGQVDVPAAPAVDMTGTVPTPGDASMDMVPPAPVDATPMVPGQETTMQPAMSAPVAMASMPLV